jgi:hypothetical protein
VLHLVSYFRDDDPVRREFDGGVEAKGPGIIQAEALNGAKMELFDSGCASLPPPHLRGESRVFHDGRTVD